MPVSRHPTRNLRKKDIVSLTPTPAHASPVFALRTTYPVGWHIRPHLHDRHQLLYADRGVIVVQAEAGRWIVPPTRGIWMTAGTTHEIRCIGEVRMHSLLIDPKIAPKLLDQTQAVAIPPLLRELLRAAMDVAQPYQAGTRDARLMRLILDELRALPVLPLHLHMPADARLLRICQALQEQPDDTSTLGDWAKRLAVDVKTVQRLFTKETGMTFGQWRQQARLLRALELLATGEKVIDVALALGYDSPSAFATMFRKNFGQSPTQFFAPEAA